MIRSMSPKQQIERHYDEWDEEAWVKPPDIDGPRWDGQRYVGRNGAGVLAFAPRESRIPAPDPWAWSLPPRERPARPVGWTFPRTGAYYSPASWPQLRAAVVTREAREYNHMIADYFREEYDPTASNDEKRQLIWAYLDSIDDSTVEQFGEVQVSEARTVLSRLQSVIEANR